ncbi:helix-turn-helix domain-containing protein [Oceanicola sp. D3]|uniref:helix-turn-helix transcriptional regulator n=1 Tax=Oceanicola sp. D3 TaxID=2587163 RepID=UPI00111D7FBD|nr:AraC family transcriptional regulator [Oceanicola sp. D3]QDC08881.1 helix-turn-helix domain-containing protein [Oceanicola sp. D3]
MPPPVLRGQLSAAMFPQESRVNSWREHFAEQFLRLDISPLGDAPFRFDVDLLSMPGLTLSGGTVSAMRCARTKRLLEDENDDLILLIPQRGKMQLNERGHVAEFGPGSAMVRHSSEVAETVSTAGEFLTLSIPRSAVAAQVGDLGRLGFAVIPGQTPALGLLDGYLRMLLAGALLPGETAPDAADAARMAVRQVQELVGLVLGGSRDHWQIASAAGGGLTAARIAAISAEIERHATEPDFGIDTVARRLQLSPGHIRKLLASEGLSFSTRLRNIRLERAMAALQQREDTAITDIALGCGFGDISYFNRCFKAHYGMTPGEARHAR